MGDLSADKNGRACRRLSALDADVTVEFADRDTIRLRAEWHLFPDGGSSRLHACLWAEDAPERTGRLDLTVIGSESRLPGASRYRIEELVLVYGSRSVLVGPGKHVPYPRFNGKSVRSYIQKIEKRMQQHLDRPKG
ncbi:hypothetical protein [Microbispora sp. CSR-4]|uniref:hypothetical protein n=1 Tax=Microbispora sp. CSR-4 TaxID=2592813 RepID=UPI0011C7DA6E|nr:hypothetical protein [Microbispora sp. CSR-4]